MKKNKILSLFLVLSVCQLSFGQFKFYGHASKISNSSCYILTPDSLDMVGAIWNTNQINLSYSFDLQYKLYLGSRNVGADGIVFVLHTDTNTFNGNVGGGNTIGYGNIAPSLGIEFDTYQNVEKTDPIFDHLAIEKNGDVDHANAATLLAGPVQISAINTDVEDGVSHRIRITWNANTKTINVYFDCNLRLTYTGDIVNDIWAGNPNVYWGFTSATGGQKNYHEMCPLYESFSNNLSDTTICNGNSVQLNFPNINATYAWSPSTGLSNSNISNPIASPEVTTTYYLNITDTCSFQFNETVTIKIECLESYLNVPNIFTPNSDEKNDMFKINYKNIDSYLIRIYNRWGNLMFQTTELNQSWDGKTTEGNYAPDGTYYYTIIATGEDKKQYNLNGFLTLIK